MAMTRVLIFFGFQSQGKFPDMAEKDGKEYSFSILAKRVNQSGPNNLTSTFIVKYDYD